MGPIGKGDGGGMEEDGGANTEVALLGVAAMVDAEFDPLITALLESKSGEESSSNNTGAGEKAGMVVVRPEQLDGGKGKVMAGLSIDLATRDRVKFAGRIVAAAVEPVLDTVKTESSGAAEDESGPTKDGGRVGKVQMAVRVDETLGNCPKYLNKKDIAPHVPNPTLASDRLPLSTEAVDIVHQADLFFMSSTNGDTMDTNHRGGAPGFVRVATNDEENGTVLVYPECE